MNKKHLITLAIISVILVIAAFIFFVPKYEHLNPQRIALMEGSREATGRVAFSRDGKLLARGFITMITVTDTTSGRKVMAASTEKGDKDTLVFSNDSTYLIAGDFYGKATIWDTEN